MCFNMGMETSTLGVCIYEITYMASAEAEACIHEKDAASAVQKQTDSR